MKNIIFSSFSLVLFKGDEKVFTSDKRGVRPLYECVIEFKGKDGNFHLFDKVIGLAAAKLVVYCGNIIEVETLLASKLAVEFLKKHNIKIHAEKIVDNIINREKTGICPMEQKAINIEGIKSFFDELNNIFNK